MSIRVRQQGSVAHVRHRNRRLLPLQDTNDVFFREPRALHPSVLFLGRILAIPHRVSGCQVSRSSFYGPSIVLLRFRNSTGFGASERHSSGHVSERNGCLASLCETRFFAIGVQMAIIEKCSRPIRMRTPFSISKPQRARTRLTTAWFV